MKTIKIGRCKKCGSPIYNIDVCPPETYGITWYYECPICGIIQREDDLL